MKKKVLCIAGMHRSGTSLTANWLNINGLFLGDQLLGKASSNPKGHFEDVEFLNLHISQLESEKLHRSGLLLPTSAALSFDKSHLIQATALAKKRSLKHLQWGWKEPRSTLFLHDWKRIIPDLKVLAVYRSPEAVINSLYVRLKRNKWYKTNNPFKKIRWYFDIDKNPQKWYAKFETTYHLYNRKILSFHQQYPDDIIVVNLEELQQNSTKLLDLLKDHFQLKLSDIDLQTIYSKEFMTAKTELQRLDLNLSESLSTYNALEKIKKNL